MDKYTHPALKWDRRKAERKREMKGRSENEQLKQEKNINFCKDFFKTFYFAKVLIEGPRPVP